MNLINKIKSVIYRKDHYDDINPKKEYFIFREGTMDKYIFESVVNLNEYNIPDKLNYNDVVIDIGAHIGSFSYLCLKRGSKHILAFEMCESNYELAKKNLNKCIEKGYVHVSKLAVWENDNEYVSYIPSTDPTNTGGGHRKRDTSKNHFSRYYFKTYRKG